MGHGKKKTRPNNESEKPNAVERSKSKESFLKTFGIMAVCIFVVFL